VVGQREAAAAGSASAGDQCCRAEGQGAFSARWYRTGENESESREFALCWLSLKARIRLLPSLGIAGR